MLCTFIRHIGPIYARELTQKCYDRLVLVHATKKVLLDVIFDKHAQSWKNLPLVLHTLSEKGYALSLSINESGFT